MSAEMKRWLFGGKRWAVELEPSRLHRILFLDVSKLGCHPAGFAITTDGELSEDEKAALKVAWESRIAEAVRGSRKVNHEMPQCSTGQVRPMREEVGAGCFAYNAVPRTNRRGALVFVLPVCVDARL